MMYCVLSCISTPGLVSAY